MYKNISILKGIHPGIVLERELKKKHIPKGRFALSIGEYPQTIGSITKGKRDMNTALSLKIEHALDLEEGYFMILQVYFDIKKSIQNQQINFQPDFSLIRPALFWDTTIKNINWEKQKTAVIKRVFERGNSQEKTEIIRFYGKQTVNKVLKILSSENHSQMPIHPDFVE